MFNPKGTTAEAFEAAYRELHARLRVSGCRDYGPIVLPPDDYDRLSGALPGVYRFCDPRLSCVHFKLGMDGVIFQRGY